MKIEHGVPCFSKAAGKSLHHPFDDIPWNDMKEGDSVVVRHNTAGGIRKRGRSNGWKTVVIQAVEKTPTGGGWSFKAFRVWTLEREK